MESPAQGPPGRPGSAGVGAEQVRPAPLPPMCCPRGLSGLWIQGRPCPSHWPSGAIPSDCPRPLGGPVCTPTLPKAGWNHAGPFPCLHPGGSLAAIWRQACRAPGPPPAAAQPLPAWPGRQGGLQAPPLPRALSLKSHQATSSHAWSHSPWSGENPCPRAAIEACPGHPDLTSPTRRLAFPALPSSGRCRNHRRLCTGPSSTYLAPPPPLQASLASPRVVATPGSLCTCHCPWWGPAWSMVCPLQHPPQVGWAALALEDPDCGPRPLIATARQAGRGPVRR